MIFSEHSLRTIPLFGGALETSLPVHLFRDVSEFFPIQDNQEVYQHVHFPDVVLTIELLEREDGVAHADAGNFFFDDVVKTESGAAGKVINIRAFQTLAERHNHFPFLFPPPSGTAGGGGGSATSSSQNRKNPNKNTKHDNLSSPDSHPVEDSSKTSSPTLSSSSLLVGMAATKSEMTPGSAGYPVPPCDYVCEVEGIRYTARIASLSPADDDAGSKNVKKQPEKEEEKKSKEDVKAVEERKEVRTNNDVEDNVANVHVAVFRFSGRVHTDIVVCLVVPHSCAPLPHPNNTTTASASPSSSLWVPPEAEEQRLWNHVLKTFCVKDWSLFL